MLSHRIPVNDLFASAIICEYPTSVPAASLQYVPRNGTGFRWHTPSYNTTKTLGSPTATNFSQPLRFSYARLWPTSNAKLGCVHINTSTSPALYRFPYTSSSQHEFAWISMAAVHIHTSTGYL